MSDLLYLDHNATTPLCPEALDAMTPFLTECWANPSSGYRFAKRAKDAITTARTQIATLLGAEPDEIIFTAGGTESSNTAIQSAVTLQPERRHLITAVTEHEATLVTCEKLAQQGYEVTRLPVDENGVISLDDLRAALRPSQTALVSLMWANNETGVMHPVAEAAALAHEHGILFHSDIVQAVGKTPITLRETHIHYASISGHKFHAPKGVGVLYVKKSARFHPWIWGGGQEAGRRSGTLNVPGIVGLGAAAAAAHEHLTTAPRHLADLQRHFESRLLAEIEGSAINGHRAPRLPNTTSLRLDGVDAQGALILLDQLGLCLSSGSACATGSHRPSHVLTGMGLTSRQARETLRLSTARTTTLADLDRALDAFKQIVRKLRLVRQRLTQ